MAVTPNYGWPVPVATDYVKDGWEAISDLGNAIDTTVAGISGMTLISTTTLTGASVTLSSIPQTYKNLQLVIRNLKPASETSTQLRMQFNADSNANRHGYEEANSIVGVINGTSGRISKNQDSVTATGLTIVDIYDYTNSVTWKVYNANSFQNDETTPTSGAYYRVYGIYNQTSAISSLVLFMGSGNFTSGTALLYGVK